MEPTPVPTAPATEILPPLAGSTSWQLLLVALAALFLFTRVLRGMQLGGPRQVVSLLALALGALCGYLASPLLMPVVHGWMALPDIVTRGLASAAIALVVIIVVEIMGVIFCRKTEDQKEPGPRRVYAMSGMVLGLVHGLLMLVILLVGLRMIGTMANMQIWSELTRFNQELAEGSLEPDPNAPPRETDGQQGPLMVSSTIGHPAVVFVAKLKNSAELGTGGDVVNKLDPMPPDVYRVLQKLVRVLSSVEATERLFQHPEISRVTQHETIAMLAQEPEIQALAEKRDLMAMLRHPRVIAAANDPAVQEDLSKVNFEGALDYALVGQRDALQESMDSGEVKVGTAP